MKNRARLINGVMNIAITALSVSAIYLLILALGVSPQRIIKNLFDGSEKTIVSTGAQNVDSITTLSPYIVLLTDEHEVHYAAKYDYQSKLRVFSQFSVTLGEALGSASGATQITEGEWRGALKAKSVFFDYLYPQPMSLIARQLGTSLPDDLSGIQARRLCLAVNGESLNLFYIDEETGLPNRLNTALSSSLFYQQASGAGLPQASFAFESNHELAKNDPYFVISGEKLAIIAAQLVSPLPPTGTAQVSLSDFSMNERTSTPYPDGSFADVFVDESKSLRISATGSVLFTVTGSRTDGIPVSYIGDSPSLEECILSAASLISSTIAPHSGDAEIGLIGVETGRSNGFTLTFGYYLNGMPVNTGSAGWCAKIVITEGNIMRAELIYREFSLQDEQLTTLPEEQAVIIALDSGGSPLLVYTENEGDLIPIWYNKA